MIGFDELYDIMTEEKRMVARVPCLGLDYATVFPMEVVFGFLGQVEEAKELDCHQML